jgi:hypothetical protein
MLYTKVKLYLEANSKTWEAEKINIKLQNDGSGDYIHTWNVSGLAKPTEEQLATYEDEANAEEALNTVYNNRRSEYPNHNDCIHALLDGGDTLTDLQAKRQEVKDKYPK